MEHNEVPRITTDHVFCGARFNTNGYDRWTVFRDSGSWWILEDDGEKATRLGDTLKQTARRLTELEMHPG